MYGNLSSPVPPLSCCLVCREVSGTLLGVGLVGFAAVAAFDGSVKTCFALGRAI